MFNISFGEIFIILVIALIVLGPERLVIITKTLGRWLSYFKKNYASIKDDVEREIKAFDDKNNNQ